jgi:hypothetical protein
MASSEARRRVVVRKRQFGAFGMPVLQETSSTSITPRPTWKRHVVPDTVALRPPGLDASRRHQARIDPATAYSSQPVHALRNRL